MRILFVGVGNPVPSFIFNRISRLEEMGVTPVIVLESGNPKLNLSRAEYIICPGANPNDGLIWLKCIFGILLHIPRVLKLWRFVPPAGLISQIKWLIKKWPLINVNDIDIIHLQWIAMGASMKFLSSFYSAPVIASARGSQVTVYPVTKDDYRELIQTAIQHVDYIHCVSNDIREHCIRFGAAMQKVFVNYNGINPEQFQSQVLRPEHSGFRLVTTGSMVWGKGYLYQLLILKELIKKNIKAELTIIGSGPDAGAIKYTSHVLGLSEKINFKGQVPHSQVQEILQDADVYLSTSIAEGLSNSVMEASASGLPVVCFRCEGMAEIIEDEKTGYIIPFGNIFLFTEKLERLYHDIALRKMMGSNGRMKMENEFDDRFWTAEMIKQYKKIAHA